MNKIVIALLFFSLNLTGPTAFGLDQGAQIPDCTLNPMAGGQSVKLGQFSGKVLYVDFWASWCGPCAKSFPFLNGIHKKYQDKGLKIIGINLDEELDDAKEFLDKYPALFTVVTDGNQRCAETFDVKAMPSSYLVDRKGTVRHIHLGFRPDESRTLEHVLEQLLAETQPSP